MVLVVDEHLLGICFEHFLNLVLLVIIISIVDLGDILVSLIFLADYTTTVLVVGLSALAEGLVIDSAIEVGCLRDDFALFNGSQELLHDLLAFLLDVGLLFDERLH
jgi:hypothetical protein